MNDEQAEAHLRDAHIAMQEADDAFFAVLKSLNIDREDFSRVNDAYLRAIETKQQNLLAAVYFDLVTKPELDYRQYLVDVIKRGNFE